MMRTLRFKLIAWFLLVLLIVIFAFGLFLYIARERSLYASLNGELKSTALQLAGLIEIDQGKVVLKTDEVTFPETLFYQVTNEQGVVLVHSGNLKEHTLPLSKTPFDKENVSVEAIQGWMKLPMQMISLRKVFREDIDESEKTIILNNGTAQTLVIECAQSTKDIDEDLDDLVDLLFWVGLVTFLVAGFGGFFLAGRALQPIKQITKTVEDISETHLSDRVDVSKFDKEFHPLVNQLNAALDRLEKAFQRERQFTADASHELRTPLAVIVNNIQVLLKRPRSAEEHLEIHQSNLQTAQQMKLIIEGLLTLTRMDAGRITLERKQANLSNLIEESWGILQSKAVDQKISFSNQVEKNMIISVDSDKFKQVFLNLLDNAITYNNSGGKVLVTATKNQSSTTITISDTGIGIPGEHITRIFERFYRVDPSRSEKTGGCGLGLAIVKSIVELHGGSIAVTSDASGTSFKIILPNN